MKRFIFKYYLIAKMKQCIFKYYIPVIIGCFVAAIIWFFKSAQGKDEISVFITIVGGLATSFYFIQNQQLEELKLFKELFTEFNGRYDKLNEELNKIVEGNSDSDLTKEEENTLNDYFNLCAEEFLFFRRGYIYPEVWKAWQNGMKFYLKDDRIKKKWTDESAAESYYGLIIKD